MFSHEPRQTIDPKGLPKETEYGGGWLQSTPPTLFEALFHCSFVNAVPK